MLLKQRLLIEKGNMFQDYKYYINCKKHTFSVFNKLRNVKDVCSSFINKKKSPAMLINP